MTRVSLLALVALVACASPKPRDPYRFLRAAEAKGKRIEPWSQAHSDWLGANCELGQAGGNQYSYTSDRVFHLHDPSLAPGNVVLIAALGPPGFARFVSYECPAPPPWERTPVPPPPTE